MLLHEGLKDASKKYFILVSDSTIPIKSPDYIANQLNTIGKSLVCTVPVAKHVNGGCYRKHHQWVILTREHAEKMLWGMQNEVIDNLFDAVDVGRGTFDEHVFSYFITGPNNAECQLVLTIPEYNKWAARFNAVDECNTFARWKIESRFEDIPADASDQEMIGHPYDFKDISEEDLRRLFNIPNVWFARKFSAKTTVSKKLKLIQSLSTTFGWNCSST